MKKYFFIILFTLITTLFLWLPFLLKAPHWFGLEYPQLSFLEIYKNFDGPLYIIPAKTLYNPESIANLKIESSLPPGYFAAHLPLYPILIRLFSFVGYLRAMVLVTVASTLLFATVLYTILVKLKITKHPLALTAVVLMIPRFLIVRSVGSPEPLFILMIILSLYFFEKKAFFWAGLAGALATMTKSPGILLFAAYGIAFANEVLQSGVKLGGPPTGALRGLGEKLDRTRLWILLIPLGLILTFTLYHFQYNDFFAYFHSGDNLHLRFPFSVFNADVGWVATPWLEDVLFWYAVYGLTALTLYKSRYRSFFWFGLVFFISTLFVQHRDISRYSLPLLPLAAIAFERFLTSRNFLLLALILLPAIYLFSWNFTFHNLMPISDWSAYR